MNAKLNRAPSRPVDDWEEFRPAGSSRQPSRSATRKLLLSAAVFVVLALTWWLFKRPITGAVAEIANAISGPGRPPASSIKPRVAASKTRKEFRFARAQRPEQPKDGGTALRPFEVYLLDGDRYIRVDASNRSVLLNTQTGETTWIDSDNIAENSR